MIFLNAFLIGAFAYVFTNILIQPGEILGFFGNWINRLPDYLRKPLGGCEACFAGQLALWFGLFYYEIPFFEIPFFIGLSILTAVYIYNKI